jgi:hypothetical protein
MQKSAVKDLHSAVTNYKENPHNICSQAITNSTEVISRPALTRVFVNTVRCVEACLQAYTLEDINKIFWYLR